MSIDGARALIERYASALAAADVDTLRDLWLQDAPGPFYVVDELHDPIFTWEALEDQLARLRARILSAQARVGSVTVRPLDPETAMAYAVMAWRIVSVDEATPRAGHSRLLATCRHASGGWRLAALIEAPLHVSDAPDGPGTWGDAAPARL